MFHFSYDFPKITPPKDFFENLNKWRKLFKKLFGSNPSFLQEFWAKKYFLGESFSLLAPTGIGKTSFGLSFCLFEVEKEEKSYIILPTRLLVSQVKEKLLNFGLEQKEVLAFEGKKKTQFEKRLLKGEFKILLTTSAYLYRNLDKLLSQKFKFIFIDDVDSFLKTARNVDKVLQLLGFSQKAINLALKLIFLKAKPQKAKKDLQKIESWERILSNIKRRSKGTLILSSATANPRSSRVKLFRELLDFEIGRAVFYLRNVLDVKVEEFSRKKLLEIVKKMGRGGLVFVPEDQGIKGVKELLKFFEGKGISAASYLDADESTFEKFKKGEIQVILGIASYKNPLSRGLDLPFACRWVIFYGVPKIKISLKEEKISPTALYFLGLIARSQIAKKNKKLLQKLDEVIRQLKEVKDKELLQQVVEKAKELLFSQEVLEILDSSPEVSIKRDSKNLEVFIADITGYLQASGRTSRFTPSGLTFGVAFLLVDDEKVFKNLVKKAVWYGAELEFIDESKIDFQKILEKIDKTRRETKSSNILHKTLLKPTLIIVESPTKARTIAGFFGKPIRIRVGEHEAFEVPGENRYFIITSSFGHIFDLKKEGGFHGVEVNSHIKPYYEVLEGRQEQVKALQKLSFEVKEVLVATDPDREGEKIGWDIGQLLEREDLKVKRAEFHEITKKAFNKAISSLRDFDKSLVKAQVVRRITDRWVGFEFSQKLQKAFGIKTLSAGRVQTPVLGWVIERAKGAKTKIWEVVVKIDGLKVNFEFEKEERAREIYKKLDKVEISLLQERIKELFPEPPFTTDRLLKEAAEKFSFTSPYIMKLAQDLFEAGFITYHRTDSTTVSSQGIKIAQEYISEHYGKDLFSPKSYKKEGAHECIRPTRPWDREELLSYLKASGIYYKMGSDHLKLYDLIFKKFIASQMKSVKVKAQSIKVGNLKLNIFKEVEVIREVLERGYDIVFKIKLVKIESLGKNKNIVYKISSPDKNILSRPQIYPFTHATLIFEMKKRGIGRPSTYAVIVDRLFARKYVYQKGPYIFPTSFGIKVYAFLNSLPLSDPFLKDEFTSQFEEVMDRVEEGKEDWEEVLRELYKTLLPFSSQSRADKSKK